MRIYNAIAIALFLTTAATSEEIYSINDLFDYRLNSCAYRELENGRVDTVEETYAPGTRVIYTCNDGYTLMGASFATCSQGSWSANLPYCAETYRPTPPPATCPSLSLPNGRVISTGSTYNVGDKVGFSCNTGYKRIGTAISECLEYGIWGSAVPICQKIVPKGCNYRELAFGSSFPKKDSYSEREVVVYECTKGYTLKGTSAAACFGGKWTTELPFCKEEPKECQFRELVNGETKPEKTVYDNLAVVLYQCVKGYELKGARGAACVNGVWSDNLPYCERKVIFSEPEIYCATPKFPRGELYPTTSDSKGYLVGSIIAFFCDLPYYRKGSQTAKCLESGEWNEIPTCEVGCKEPVIENGYYETDGQLLAESVYEQGQQVLFHCNPTYKISGEISATCKKNGRWSVKLPTCEKWVVEVVEKGCPPPIFPAGTYTPTLANSKTVYSVGDRVVFTCNDEYHAKGKNYATCLKSGKWTRFPTCTDECIPPSVVHGKVKSITGSFKYTSQISLKCNAGYIAIGPTQATCLRGGVWSAQLRCSDGCYAPKIAHMQIIPAPVNGGNAYEFGHRIRFKCDLGFSTTVAEAECRGKNKWNKALPKCSLLSSNPTTSGCRHPKLSAGLVLKNQKQSVYPFKTQLEFKCEKGYNMIGSAVSICRKHNGGRITGRLDPLPPTCQPKQCGSPGKPQNGRFVNDKKNAYYVGDVVDFACDNRYVMTGSSSITCQANGQWSDLAPKCAPPSCKKGCDYVLRRECQCDIKCGDRGDCCHDFDQLCRHLFY